MGPQVDGEIRSFVAIDLYKGAMSTALTVSIQLPTSQPLVLFSFLPPAHTSIRICKREPRCVPTEIQC